MQIPGLGTVSKDARFGWYCSQAIRLPLLNDAPCIVQIDGYDADVKPEEFHAAIARLIACPRSVLLAAESHVYRYYQDSHTDRNPADEGWVRIASPADVWLHVQLGDKLMVTRRAYGDQAIYVSIEGRCDWEPEHGLQIVLKNGESVVKVGPYDGHLTQSDAYDDDSLEGVIYR